MTNATREAITASDAELRRVLEEAHLPSLLPALAHVTGDLSLLRDDLMPAVSMSAPQGGLTPEKQAAARELASKALRRFRDGGSVPAAPPSEAALRTMVDFLSGKTTSDDYVPLLLEELGYPKADARAPKWRKDQIDAGRQFRVAIVGAGMSGIVAAIRLKQAGVPYVIFDKNSEAGGTWWENTYPGARVDSPNHAYSYSFAQKVDWPDYFSPQQVLLDYFQGVADAYGIREEVRYHTEVLSATWDGDRCVWAIRLQTPAGEESVEAEALISAVGQLNRPKMPDIEGVGRFAGPAFHSARWNHDVDLNGKRVVVIGTGASAIQLVPVVASQAAQLTLFQRTPPWFDPQPTYYDQVAPGLLWLLKHVPHYAQWYRFWNFWSSADAALPAVQIESGWDLSEASIGTANDELRTYYTEYLREQFAGRPDLLAKVVPAYPPGAKRIVLDNGTWARTLTRPNVELNTEKIREITARGVVTEDGVEHEADVIIYGTGFQPANFLAPMTIVGRNGIDLNEQWGGDARAYLGIVAPNFPNFFLMYGPNTNIVVHGSIPYFSECEVDYIMASIKMLLETRHAGMDCRQDVHDRYNEWVDEGNLNSAWGYSKVISWYKNSHGRVAQNWPFTLLKYWQQTREANPADYEFIEARVTG